MTVTILTKTTRFINDAAGLEKTLRLLQAIAQIFAAYSLSTVAAQPWLVARKQLALGRRYLRIVKFIDAFNLGFEVFSKGGWAFEMREAVEFVKWNCLGVYLGLESLTVLDAMGVYQTSWAAPLFLEAMKFWFYSLSASLLLGVIEWFSVSEQKVVREKNKKDGEKEKAKIEERERGRKRRIVKKLVTDACDLFIPGSITGWLAIESANVGWCSVVSTILAGMDVWVRVQAERS